MKTTSAANNEVLNFQKRIKALEEENSALITNLELNENPEFFHDLITNANYGIAVYTTELKYQFWNPFMEKLTGIKAHEILGKHPGDYFPFLVENKVIDKLNDLLINGGYFQTEFPYKTKYQEGWANDFSSVIKDKNNKITGIIAIVTDITERKQTEQALSKAKETAEETQYKLSKAQELGDIGTWELDIQKNILTWTDENYKIFGVPLETTLTFELFLSCVHPEDREFVHSEWISKIRTNRYDIEHRILVNNKVKWVREKAEISFDKKGEPIKAIGYTQDISEKKQKEIELVIAIEKAEESDILKNKLIANIGDVIVIIDHEGNNRYKSPNVEKLFGWKPEELIGNNAFDNIHPDDLEKARTFIDSLLSEPNKTGTTEIRYKRKNGNYIWIEFTGSNLLNDPIINGVLGNYHDISERKNTEIELAKVQEKARKYTEMILSSQSVANICSYSTNLIEESIENSIWECSPEFYKIFGIDETYPHTIAGWAGFIHPNFREELVAYHESVIKTRTSFNKEYKIIRINDGAERWVHGTGELVYNKHGNPIRMHGAIQDITEMKETKDALINAKERAEENQIKYRSMFTSMQEGVYLHEIIYNNQGKAVNYRITDANPISEKYLNIKTSDAIGKLATALFGTETAPFIDIYTKVAETGNPYTFEQYFEPMDKYFYISVFSPKKGEFATSFLDITKTKLFENELIKAKEVAELNATRINEQKVLFETMFNTIQEGIVITNTNREIILANNGMLTTFGYNPEELTGKQTKIFYADLEKFNVAGEKVFNKEAVSGDKEYLTYYKHKNKNIFPGETFGAKLFNNKGEWIGNIGIIRDVSERERFINDLQIAKDTAEKANRLKTEFLNNMSHEVRTPMNGIIGFSEMLDKPDITEEKRKFYSKIVQNSSHQLLRIIDDILEISTLETKQEKIDETEFCLNSLLMEIFSVFNIKSKERKIHIYLKKALKDDQSLIISDKTKLNKILGNLLENAVKFTNEGFIELGYHIEGNNLIIYVKDTGIGILPENKEIIFERFSQEDKKTSRDYGGLGLGLSISKENAQLLGGNITLESEKEKGSTFYVTLPYKRVKDSDETNSGTVSGQTNTKGKDKYVILVAEDEEINYLYIEALLEQQNDFQSTVVHAKNGQEAVELCHEHKNIDIVLMDIKMPVMNGLEATEKIKSVFPKLPVIAQTAYSTEADKQLALKHGCDDFISKPLDNKMLIGMISKYLDVK